MVYGPDVIAVHLPQWPSCCKRDLAVTWGVVV
jgi:hypothetical protein